MSDRAGAGAPDRSRELTHDRLTDRFDELMDDYDLGRRTEVLVDRFLGDGLRDRLVLDAGCGVGGITRALVARGARVVALDIGPKLAAETRARCGCAAVVGTLSATGFRSGSFDVVVSSEAVEHTPDPRRAVVELYRLVRPGGALVISMPNRLWQAPVRAASAIGLRPYDGYENFLWPSELRRALESAGATVIEHRGIHLWPFQIAPLRRASRWVDRFGRALLPLMINQCLHCVKPMYNPEVFSDSSSTHG
jgi:2-polyprenyl-6-hydroxyphenyl methylase/3-demethylubiquinone-9 3-methyltransferase